jgi:hypothetical protein
MILSECRRHVAAVCEGLAVLGVALDHRQMLRHVEGEGVFDVLKFTVPQIGDGRFNDYEVSRRPACWLSRRLALGELAAVKGREGLTRYDNRA